LSGYVSKYGNNIKHEWQYRPMLPDLQFEEISLLPLDHPGAQDLAYRARRDYIAGLARQYRQDPQHVIPVVEYTQEEREVWQYVCCQLEKVQAQRACSLYLQAKRALGISCLQNPATVRSEREAHTDEQFSPRAD
jgi:hypothetical protein